MKPPMFVSSRRHPMVKRVLKVSNGRGESGEVFIEGLKPVEEAVKAGCELSVLAGEKNSLQAFGRSAIGKNARIKESYQLSSELIGVLSDTVSPQGLCAVADRPRASLEEVLALGDQVLLWLDRLQDPGNVGGMIRSALAFGVRGVLVTRGTASPWGPKALRAAAGLTFRTVTAEVGEMSSWKAQADRAGYQVVLAHPREGMPPASLKGQKLIIGIGNEARGFDAETLKLADRVTLPLKGEVESLNAAVATSLILYELTRVEEIG